MRHDTGRVALAAGQLIGGNGQIRCAAADVDGGNAHAGMIAVGGARFAHQAEKMMGVAVLFDGQLIVEQDQLRTTGFVPVATYLRAQAVIAALPLVLLLGQEPLAPAQGVPDHPHGPEHPTAEDAFFRHGHGRGHGEDQPPQPSGQIGQFPPGPGGRGIDGDQGLGEDFAHHEEHQGRTGKQGFKNGLGLLFLQGRALLEQRIAKAGQGRALRVELAGEQPAADHGLGLAAGVVAPALLPRAFVPEIALGAGHAGGAFGADGLSCQACGFRPDTHGRRPGKSRALAARAPGKGVVAESRVHKFHAGFKGLGVDPVRLAEIAQFQQIAVIEIGDALGQGFHQYARGAGIADVQNQIHIHRCVAVRIDDLGGQVVEGQAHHFQPGQIAGQVFKNIGRFFLPGAAPVVFALPPGAVNAGKPFIHPGCVEEPGIVAHLTGQHEMSVGRHVLR